MKRHMVRMMLLALLSGLGVQAQGGPYMSDYHAQKCGCVEGASCGAYQTPTVPNVVGPWGQPVPMAFPYSAAPPSGDEAARAMLAQSVPFDMQMALMAQGRNIPGAMPMGPGPSPMPAGSPVLPPGMTGYGPPGAMPGPRGFDPGSGLQLTGGDNNIIQTGGGPKGPMFAIQRTEVRFAGPAGMKITWYITQPDGKQGFGPQSLEAPGRYNFLQAAIYRLKLSDIPNRPGVELYPTLEVVPANSKTSTFLAHAAVPVSFTDEDFDQVAAGNFVVKVIYLPDPQFQDLASTGLAEVVSSQLEPGVDPITEAQRRGNILLVVRLGNIDLEAPNTPAMDTPGSRSAPHMQGQPMFMQPNVPGMSRMVPYGTLSNNGARPPMLGAPNQNGPMAPMQQPGAQGLPAPGPFARPGQLPQGQFLPPQGQPAARPLAPPNQFPPGALSPAPFQPPVPGPSAQPAQPPTLPQPSPTSQLPASPGVQPTGFAPGAGQR